MKGEYTETKKSVNTGGDELVSKAMLFLCADPLVLLRFSVWQAAPIAKDFTKLVYSRAWNVGHNL